MNAATAWQAGEHCPDCGTEMALLDDGTSQARLDCAACGYADVRAVSDPAGGGSR